VIVKFSSIAIKKESRAGNGLDITLTNALLSRPETGKINRVYLPRYVRLPPGAIRLLPVRSGPIIFVDLTVILA
jgi:hypothetical protein